MRSIKCHFMNSLSLSLANYGKKSSFENWGKPTLFSELFPEVWVFSIVIRECGRKRYALLLDSVTVAGMRIIALRRRRFSFINFNGTKRLQDTSEIRTKWLSWGSQYCMRKAAISDGGSLAIL